MQFGSTSLGLQHTATPAPPTTSSTYCTGVTLYNNAGLHHFAASTLRFYTAVLPPQQATKHNSTPRWQKGSAGGMPNQPLPMVRCAPSNTLLHTPGSTTPRHHLHSSTCNNTHTTANTQHLPVQLQHAHVYQCTNYARFTCVSQLGVLATGALHLNIRPAVRPFSGSAVAPPLSRPGQISSEKIIEA